MTDLLNLLASLTASLAAANDAHDAAIRAAHIAHDAATDAAYAAYDAAKAANAAYA